MNIYNLAAIDAADDVLSSAATANVTAVRGAQEQLLPLPVESLTQRIITAEIDASYNSRQCIIDKESRLSGMYVAEYGGRPGGSDGSTASGAYQWVDSSWRDYVPRAEAYYGVRLTSPEEESHAARLHAAYASPFVQDLVTAFALIHPNLAQNQHPWPYGHCWALVGSTKQLRSDGLEFGPTAYIESQIG